MKNKTLHVVAFDYPYPPNYGGIIDIYFKIRALHELGVRVILHVFMYDGKGPEGELKKICHKIYYYNRKKFTNPFSGDIPYIVSTRTDDNLLLNLKKDKFPILFEGLHTTAFLNHPDLSGRYRIVRTHNVEHHYYKALEEAETGFFKKYFFRVESERLENYENILAGADVIAAISPEETAYYQEKFGNTKYIAAFHSNHKVNCRPGRGRFILYHGNLGVGENNKAALFLVHEVFSKLEIPVIVAGNNPSRQLKQAVKGNPYITLTDHVSTEEILELIAEAHINVLVTFQTTGIKLKLLNSLYRGRHCLVNPAMVVNTGLENLCHIAHSPTEFQLKISELWESEFNEWDKEGRSIFLERDFNNLTGAQKIVELLP